jgi:hypothetical protein
MTSVICQASFDEVEMAGRNGGSKWWVEMARSVGEFWRGRVSSFDEREKEYKEIIGPNPKYPRLMIR